jgi:bifunctional DNA-binding transcriptional regulator/antitoxin component of YhaV-PrlF toxin-antitoxin module
MPNSKNIRKITKNGTSHSVSIPVEILKKLGWKERQKVVVRKIRGGVSIKDWRAHPKPKVLVGKK